MKIYILDALHEAGINLAKEFCEVVCWPDPSIKNWPEDADGVMVRMTPITAEQITRSRHVKVIAKQGVGVDTIDLVAAKKRGIPILRNPGINSEAVAEMALALGLAATRRIVRFDRMLRAGDEIIRPKHLGIEMAGRTVGIVGMGHIGTATARKWVGAFNAKIIAYSPRTPLSAWPDIPHTRASSLEELLAQVDLLSLHLPLSAETRHMLSTKEFALMKKDAVLVNVARGGIVDEAALYEALKSGHLFGAGIDVFAKDPPQPDDPLLSLPNVVATPHAAGGTFDTPERSSRGVAQQVIRVLQGLEPLHRVV